MTRRQVREEDVGKMEIDFQCVVLKAYGANTKVFAFFVFSIDIKKEHQKVTPVLIRRNTTD